MSVRISPKALEAVRDAQDFDSLKELAQKVVERLGFDGFMYATILGEDLLSSEPRAFSESRAFFLGTYDPDYMKAYELQQWVRIDPAAQQMLKTHLPFVWRNADFNTPDARLVIETANAYGVGAGAVFPVVSSNLTVGGFGIARDADPDAEYERTLEILPFGQLLSIYVHAATNRILEAQRPPALKGISRREQECLQMAARGMRDADIAKALSITARTVISHLNSSRCKLQAENRSQMIARAMALKLIRL